MQIIEFWMTFQVQTAIKEIVNATAIEWCSYCGHTTSLSMRKWRVVIFGNVFLIHKRKINNQPKMNKQNWHLIDIKRRFTYFFNKCFDLGCITEMRYMKFLYWLIIDKLKETIKNVPMSIWNWAMLVACGNNWVKVYLSLITDIKPKHWVDIILRITPQHFRDARTQTFMLHNE